MHHPDLKTPYSPDALLAAAARFGTPTYVYFEDIISERITRLTSHLDGLPLKLLYAMKANHAPRVLDVIRRHGLGIDAVSPAELLLALRVGFEPEDILFSANNMTNEEMEFALSCGVTLNIGELSRLEKLGKAHPGTAVSVRINPSVGAGHHEHVITAGAASKFGIPVEQLDDIIALADASDIRIKGLHQHIGSGILDTSTLWKAISVMLDTALRFSGLEFVNFGGGLGVPYRADDAGLDLNRFGTDIVHPLKEYIRGYPSEGLQVRFEPGRYFTAESGVLLATVNTIKQTRHATFVGVDSGMGHLLRPAMYEAWHGIYNLSNPTGALERIDVVGNICESADFFARRRMVQHVREGDVLAILDAGAYGMSMASTYNLRPLPSEVMIGSDGSAELVSLQETPTQMVERLFA